jgi:hypothetical protein
VILTGVTASVMLSAWVAVCAVGVVESVTLTVKLKVPDAVGVPEIEPVEAVKLSPAGNEPELMLQMYGVVPPVAASVAVYAVPCVPFDSELVVMLTADVVLESTVMLRAWVAVWAVGVVESVTFTVKLNVPAEVGVPEITPLDAVKLSPGGRRPELMLQVYGVTPPVAVKVAE